MKLIIFFCLIFCIPLTLSAYEQCDAEFRILRNIQDAMRKGYSEWQGEYARDAERNARKRYQECRRDKNAQSNSNQQTDNEVNSTNNYIVESNQQSQNTYRQNSALNRQYSPNYNAHAIIVMNGKYRGVKQTAWLKFYKPSPECIQPKTTTEFATCINKRDLIALEFEKYWRANNAPPSIILD